MNVLLIALLGVVVVLVAILVLRLHPMLGLLLASLFVLAATPWQIRLEQELASKRMAIVAVQGRLFALEQKVASPSLVVWEELLASHSQAEVWQAKKLNKLPSDLPRDYDVSTYWYQMESSQAPTLTLNSHVVLQQDYVAANAHRWSGLGKRLAASFADTFRQIGIPVTMAAIIGVCLIESGAAARMVAALVAMCGQRLTAPALSVSGFVLGIPVYFDTVFYLLLPIAKAIGSKQPAFYLSAIMAIIVGATMAHSLVPPTPGPLLVASLMHVSIGAMMLGGFVVGGCAAAVGFVYGIQCRKWIKLEPEQQPIENQPDAAVKEIGNERKISLFAACLPIVLPIILLGGTSILESLKERPALASLSPFAPTLDAINDPALVFILTAVLAILLTKRYAKVGSDPSKVIAKGLADAGVIVLLTCAGGAFGKSLQQLGLAEVIAASFDGFENPWSLLVVAFFLTAIVRAAQGSATVAMITSAEILSHVALTTPLPFHPIYLALAIGCGSKPLPWMNDSGFWQVATMTGMTPGQTLKTFTVALTLMGFVGFGVTFLGAWLFPMV